MIGTEIYILEYAYDGLLIEEGYFFTEQAAEDHKDTEFPNANDITVRCMKPNKNA